MRVTKLVFELSAVALANSQVQRIIMNIFANGYIVDTNVFYHQLIKSSKRYLCIIFEAKSLSTIVVPLNHFAECLFS